MELVVATGNDHKVEEIRLALPGVTVMAPAELGVEFDHEEVENTFVGNSLGKALALRALLNVPVLADDSGLCVDALGGRPGVLSARYGSAPGSPPLSSEERNAMLLREMEGVARRSCRFVCALSLAIGPDRLFVFQETCEGELLSEPRGRGGFGYDPIVWLPELGMTVAELSAEEKNRVSHRGRAIARLRAVLEDLDSL